MSREAERLAWLVLQTINRTQTKDSTARLAVPRDPEVVDELGINITEEELLLMEEYLEDRGYLERADISLTRGTYTITPAGLRWLQEKYGALELPTVTDEEAPEGPGTQTTASGDQRTVQDSQTRSWWQRMFRGSWVVPQVPKNVRRDIARDLSALVGEFGALKGEATHQLSTPEYATLKYRLEAAHAAAEAAGGGEE